MVSCPYGLNPGRRRSMATWTFDPLHTQVEFSAKHFGMMTVRGNFSDVTATGDIYPDQPERSKVDVTIRPASIRTPNDHLQEHEDREKRGGPRHHDRRSHDQGYDEAGDPEGGEVRRIQRSSDGPSDWLRRGDHDQPQGLRHELRRGGGRQICGQPRYPDQHRGRTRRGGEKGGGRYLK